MAPNGSPLTYEGLRILQSNWIQNCVAAASSTFVLHKHVATLPHEVELIWGRKWSSVTLLFFLNRWFTFIWAMRNFLGVYLILDRPLSCNGFIYFNNIMIFLLYMIWAVFSGIRMYAISGRIWWLASAVSLLNLAPVVVNSYADFAVPWFEVYRNECIWGSHLSHSTNTAFAIGTRMCVIAADALVLLVTWTKTYATHREAVRNNIQTPVTALLLKDGTSYFTILLLLNILSIIGNSSKIFPYAVDYLTTPLSSSLITHFLLDLRQVAAPPVNQSLDASSLSFTHSQGDSQAHQRRSRRSFSDVFVDNMGEDLDFGRDVYDETTTAAWPADYINDDSRETGDTGEDDCRIDSEIREYQAHNASIVSDGSMSTIGMGVLVTQARIVVQAGRKSRSQEGA